MERRTGQVVSEIPLDELVIGGRYTITYIDHNFERDGGDRIKSFRGTLENIQIWPQQLDGRHGARAGDRFFHFENTTIIDSSGNPVPNIGLHEALIIRVEKYNIAPYGIPGLSRKINEYTGGRKKRRRKKRTRKRRKKKTKKRRKKRRTKKTKRRR